MPTPTPVPVVRIRLLHEFPTGTIVGSRFFLKYTDAGAPSIADLNSYATFVRTSYTTNGIPQLYAGAVLYSVIIDDLASATGNQGTDTTTVTGTRAGTEPPQEQVLQLNFKVAQHYRGGKFKIFLPWGVTGDQANVQKWGNTFLTGAVTAWNNFITALNGHTSGGFTGNNQVGVSYFSGAKANPNLSKWARKNVPAPRGTPVVYDIVGVTSSPFISSLRKRQGRP